MLSTLVKFHIFMPHRTHAVRKMCTYYSATDGVAWSVCLLVTFVSHAKTAESIEMPFGGLTHIGTRKYKLTN